MKNVAKSWLLCFLSAWMSFLEHAKGIHYRIKDVSCPSTCLCKSNNRVECVNKSLKTAPNDLPPSTVFLDLSQNKDIHIPETYFNTFSQLRHLSVRNCELEKCFDLPKKLMTIMVQNNKLPFEKFHIIFSNSSRFLRSIYAGLNNISIQSKVPLFENAAFFAKRTFLSATELYAYRL